MSLLALALPYFNPRSSCEERPEKKWLRETSYKFQSTLLMRGATLRFVPFSDSKHFNPRSSCEERHGLYWCKGIGMISIHAPHARSDPCHTVQLFVKIIFQSTLLMRGATKQTEGLVKLNEFQSTLLMRGATSYDNSHSSSPGFQSTLLMRGATAICGLQAALTMISIHAPHARSDLP